MAFSCFEVEVSKFTSYEDDAFTRLGDAHDAIK